MTERTFQRLGSLVERRWRSVLVFWGLLFLSAMALHRGWYDKIPGFPFHVPRWSEVATDGEFAFLPTQMQSIVAERLLGEAFPRDLLKSSVVIVVRRHKQPLRAEDEAFIEDVLRPRLEQIRESAPNASELPVRTFKDQMVGRLLVSPDKEASLVIIPLAGEFLEWRNKPAIDEIEALLEKLPHENDPDTGERLLPVGLDLAMSGSATVGRDMLVAGDESAKATELATVVLVVLLLGAIYRAPILAMIPLLTVHFAVKISQAVVVLLTQIPVWEFRTFIGLEVYITVVVYGTGVDYCLFLIARYKEELDAGLPIGEALASAHAKVGAALVASAATVICGIFMMVFAQFGKFQSAGIAISLSLCIGLAAAMTLPPALLRLAGRPAFWPYGRAERIPRDGARFYATSLIGRLVERNRFHVFWERVSRLLVRCPGRILTVSFLLMLPCAFVGIAFYEYLSYGLLSELPPHKQSVKGAKAVQEHFPAGYAGTLTTLVEHPQADFNSTEGKALLDHLIERLKAQQEQLGIADIRYLREPLGMNPRSEGKSATELIVEKGVMKKRAPEYYVSSQPGLEGHVTRIDIVFRDDPFSRESIRQLDSVEGVFRNALHDESLASIRDAKLHFVGPTASIRDLKTVTDHDQIKIDLLVLGSVFLILYVLLRKFGISLYLIVSVFFSYFVTLGMTFIVFWAMDPAGFGGLDWKVTMFLFTILIAIGEDYNIFLMTRIEEEQREHGPIEGIRVAVLRTGTIISSCGIIMAGTFCSLMFGTLVGMQQLGFALAFGVLLDTFVVRPLLVPAYLILLHSGRFGAWGRFLGGEPPAVTKRAPPKVREHADV